MSNFENVKVKVWIEIVLERDKHTLAVVRGHGKNMKMAMKQIYLES